MKLVPMSSQRVISQTFQLGWRSVRTPGKYQTNPGICAAVKQQYGSFQEMVDQSTIPLLVDFYASWCGPCQMMNGVLEVVSEQLQGQVKVIKINSEKYPQLSTKYNIQGLPTLLVFKNGDVVYRLEGYVQAQALISLLRGFLQ
eukprot:TRINITY_DN1204_c0_g1_i2.p1 TRINITY_DN1204_c0_g1~~TRINITY_DN1204_c0_g1_i2.p1  ORF type:complete len:143 (-),score=2.63 TRINITY_DN1204_c0_g1_i2:321-749(-)